MNCNCCNQKIKAFTNTYVLNEIYINHCCADCNQKWNDLLPSISVKIETSSIDDLINYIQQAGLPIHNANISLFYESLKIMQDNKKIELERERKKQEELDRENMLKQLLRPESYNNILLTTGFNFDGYKIVNYCGIYSGESVLGTGFISEFTASVSDITGTSSKNFSGKLYKAKEAAIKNLKTQCLINGANAIIGINFNYITFSSNMIGVIANGTAVQIEKI